MVKDRTKFIKILGVPDLHHTLILETDLWRVMGVVPNLRSDEW